MNDQLPSKELCRQKFDEFAADLGLCMDEIFMSSTGVPENPFEDGDTSCFYRAWLASWKACEAPRPSPEPCPAPSGDWLWGRLMDWCKKRDYAPAQMDDLFAIVREARAAQPQPPEQPKGLLQETVEWALQSTEQQKHDAFEWLRQTALGGNEHASVAILELAALKAGATPPPPAEHLQIAVKALDDLLALAPMDSAWRRWEEMVPIINKALDKIRPTATKQQEQPPGDSWVSVKDRLPQSLKMVLLHAPTSPRGAVDWGFLDYRDRRFRVQTMGGWDPADDFGEVTHWMLPPTPPTKGAMPYAGNAPGSPSRERFENDDGSDDHVCGVCEGTQRGVCNCKGTAQGEGSDA